MLKGMRFLLLGEMIYMRHKTETYAKVNISMKTLNFVYITLWKKEKRLKCSVVRQIIAFSTPSNTDWS